MDTGIELAFSKKIHGVEGNSWFERHRYKLAQGFIYFSIVLAIILTSIINILPLVATPRQGAAEAILWSTVFLSLLVLFLTWLLSVLSESEARRKYVSRDDYLALEERVRELELED